MNQIGTQKFSLFNFLSVHAFRESQFANNDEAIKPLLPLLIFISRGWVD